MYNENDKNEIKVSKTSGIIIEKQEKQDLDEVFLKKEKKKEEKSFFKEWIIPMAIALVIAILINKFIIFKVYIPSESMVPTLNVEDRLLVTRIYDLDKIQRGDILVFYSDELQESLIKRVIGLPGDTISIKEGAVYVNQKLIDEPYIGEADKFSGNYQVPEGKYFFLGDNRWWSKDSRYWSNPYIDGSKIEGKAQVKVYPFDEIGKIK